MIRQMIGTLQTYDTELKQIREAIYHEIFDSLSFQKSWFKSIYCMRALYSIFEWENRTEPVEQGLTESVIHIIPSADFTRGRIF